MKKEYETVVVQPKQTRSGARFSEALVKVEFVGTELVRCKDCKHYERLMHLCRKFDEYGFAETDYCSRGERMDGGENGSCD